MISENCETQRQTINPFSTRSSQGAKTTKDMVSWTSNDFKAFELYSKREVALKMMGKQVIRSFKMQKQLKREIEIHSHLNHKHIVKMYGYFHDEIHVYVVLELATGGNLFSKLVKSKFFSEEDTAKYMYQLASAVGYLQARNVIHRDLKLENILVDDKGELKISDFGWAVHTIDDKRSTICGTIDYLAPEIVRREEYDCRIDIWCLGILMYEMLYGTPPFNSSNKQETMELIKKREFKFRDDRHIVSSEAKDLINKVILELYTL